jgi:glycosyltransferase involved in cell wall biosynthesis
LTESNPSLRVLHVYRTYFPDPPGGLQEAIRQICLATALHGVEAKIFVLSPDPEPRSITAPEGEVIRSLSLIAPASCDLGGVDAFRKFRKLVAWSDVVHYHFPWPFADILHQIVGSGKPSVMTYHSDIVRQKLIGIFYSPLMRRMLKSMSAIVATSPAYAKTSEVLNSPAVESRLRVIPLGIVDYRHDARDTAYDDVLSRFPLGDSPFILSLGVLRYYKGLHTLVQAAKAIRGTIVIAGSGPEDVALKNLGQELNVSNIIFAGQVTNSEKIALLERCRALALPSHMRSEAFGMVLVEAAMFGKPMVCCEVGSGTSYVNKNDETGFVVPPESPDEFAGACNRLIEDEVLAMKMGNAARVRYENYFSGDALGLNYLNLYNDVLKRDK